MANSLIQFRTEESSRITENKAIRAMKTSGRIAEENGIADMTLDEINAEIAATRK